MSPLGPTLGTDTVRGAGPDRTGETNQDQPNRGKTSRVLALLLGFAVPALIYALVITRGTFDLLDDEYGWRAYNAYALALLDGRTDVPLEVIGAEGFIIDGKVYMYYGMLPAFARWLLIPFIDLEETPVSLLMTWLFSTIASGTLQAAVLRIYWSIGLRTLAAKGLLLAASLGVWLGSGPWLAVQNGNFYHEPFAAGLMLAGIATYMLVDDAILKARTPSGPRLCIYALLAGLAVFARQTMALSLYALTIALIAAPILIQGLGWASVVRTIRRSILPCSILAAFGGAYMWSNYARFGGDPYPMMSYGYHILSVALKEDPFFADKLHRLNSMEETGQFHAARIIPNLVYYLIGGADFRTALIERLGGGYTDSFGEPVRMIVAWAVPLLLGLVGLWHALVRPGRLYLLTLIAALGSGGILQLAYATAQYRYVVELWPVVALLLCLGLVHGLRGVASSRAGRRSTYSVLLVAVVMVGYNLQFIPYLQTDVPNREGSLTRPMPPELTRLVER